MKNEPALNLEMKDFSPAVGMMPLTLWRVFGTTPLAACLQATLTSQQAEEIMRQR